MHKSVDTSELTEQQKVNLVESYFDELARIYRRRSDVARSEDEPIHDLFQVLLDKENDVLKLKGWVSNIINQHICKRMADSLNAAVTPPPPLEYLHNEAVAALSRLQKAMRALPPPSPPHNFPIVAVSVALDLMNGVVGKPTNEKR
jgi:hypothetical protein